MKRTLLIIAVLAALTLTAAECSYSSANIAQAYMAEDSAGATVTTTYAQDATFYAIVDLRNAPDDTVVRAEWFAVNAEGTEPNLFITSTEIETNDTVITFDLTNDPGLLWPLGTYRVDLHLDDKLDRSLEFSVQ